MKNVENVTVGNTELNSLTNIKGIISDLEDTGFVLIDSRTFHKVQNESQILVTDKDKLEFIISWQNLEVDRFMSDNGVYRTRKHATFTINSKSKIYNKNDYQPHYQTTEYNTLNGGVERFYKEIDTNTIRNPIFKNLIQFAYSAFDKNEIKSWYVEAHQFRIEAKNQIDGKPTPEGIHRDGVDYVLMAMVNKENVVGGITTIYDLNRNALTSFELKDFLDIAIVNDHIVYHGVSEIQLHNNINSKVGVRDILVLTFKELNK